MTTNGPPRRVVFLDVDGVLATVRSNVHHDNHLADKLDPVAVRLVNKLCDSTGARLVMSSTWRFEAFTVSGVKPELAWEPLFTAGLWRQHVWNSEECLEGSLTPNNRRFSHVNNLRGLEIKEWLETHAPDVELEDVVILDDENDFLDEQQSRWVPGCTWENGLLLEHAEEAAKLLGFDFHTGNPWKSSA